ncbi:MAG: alpha/beta hydrolase [Beijerinckiaceae bacterium]
MSRISATLALSVSLLAGASGVAWAQTAETVNIGGSNAVLLMPKAPRASVILMPGGNGSIGATAGGRITQLRGNQLVRTRNDYLARGLAVLVTDSNTNLASAVNYMAKIKRPVTVIATSRGTQRAAQGIAAGARPDALVLTAGFLSPQSGADVNVMSILGSAAALPRTLVIHHRQDGCRFTLAAGVDPFIAWSAGRARVAWLSGGANAGDPCGARAYHGFNGLDGQVVALAAGFR